MKRFSEEAFNAYIKSMYEADKTKLDYKEYEAQCYKTFARFVANALQKTCEDYDNGEDIRTTLVTSAEYLAPFVQ